MLRALVPLILLATPALAAERKVAITNFDRIRVDGPFEVRLTTRATPNATVSGDAGALDGVSVKVEGDTLIIRPTGASVAARVRLAGTRPVVAVQTRDLRSAGVIGGGTLTIAGPIAAQRIDLTVTGAGRIAAPGIAADELVATLIGDGQLTLGGTARSARLLGNGSGQIAAADLTVNDALVRTDGSIAVTVTARYTANASSTGLGPIEILGKPDCKVRAQAGGPISCFNAPTKTD